VSSKGKERKEGGTRSRWPFCMLGRLNRTKSKEVVVLCRFILLEKLKSVKSVYYLKNSNEVERYIDMILLVSGKYPSSIICVSWQHVVAVGLKFTIM
jgi:hypothetical protein